MMLNFAMVAEQCVTCCSNCNMRFAMAKIQ